MKKGYGGHSIYWQIEEVSKQDKIMVNTFVMTRMLIILPKQDKNKNSQKWAAAWFREKEDLSI